MTYLKTTQSHTVEDYPYGYSQRTSMTFSIEFNPSKGFRTVKQSVNPRTGQLNKPKKSTYQYLKVLKLSDDGKISVLSLDFYDAKAKERAWKFLSENFDLFTQEQMQYLIKLNISLLKASIKSKHIYCNADVNKLLPLYKPAIGTLTKMYNENLNLWADVNIEWEASEALEDKDYKPFKIT